jgi:hypothetical protein
MDKYDIQQFKDINSKLNEINLSFNKALKNQLKEFQTDNQRINNNKLGEIINEETKLIRKITNLETAHEIDNLQSELIVYYINRTSSHKAIDSFVKLKQERKVHNYLEQIEVLNKSIDKNKKEIISKIL